MVVRELGRDERVDLRGTVLIPLTLFATTRPPFNQVILNIQLDQEKNDIATVPTDAGLDNGHWSLDMRRYWIMDTRQYTLHIDIGH